MLDATKLRLDESAVVTELVDVYKVTANSDQTEGRGYPIILGHFLTKEEAVMAGKRRGGMGTDCKPTKHTIRLARIDGEFFLVGDAIQVFKDAKEMLKAQALAKLTREEKAALGV